MSEGNLRIIEDGEEGTLQDGPLHELIASPEETARKAVHAVFREDAAQMIGQYTALVKNRMGLLGKLYENIELLNDDIFTPDNFARLTVKEKLFALSIHLKAVKALDVSLEEQKTMIKQINVQINQIIKEDKVLTDLPQESKTKIRNIITQVLNKSVDITEVPPDTEADDYNDEE